MGLVSHILLVEDDNETRALVASALELEGHRVSQAADSEEALDLLKRHGFQLVLTDLYMPGADGMRIVDQLQEISPRTPAIVMTGMGTVDVAVRAMRRGAFDFLEKPLSMDKLRFAVRRALERAALSYAQDYLRREQPYIYRLDNILAESEAMKRVLERVARIAPSEVTVLITGETGTGKSLIAGAVHFNSERQASNLVTVNCAALTETLLESELFGHEKGAFTGAHKARTGRFQQAHGGTLFLDEVGDMSAALQAKVLRAIEDKVIHPVGGGRSIHVDVRIIAATNRNLEEAVREGNFRDDLYYRLNVATLRIAPLRERQEDIIPLARKFVRTICQEAKSRPKTLNPEAEEALKAYHWPGNIREMRNVIERAVLFSGTEEITIDDLDLKQSRQLKPSDLVSQTLNLTELESRAIVAALESAGWVQSKAAKMLGISPRALSYKLDKLNLDHPKLAARRRR
ncbi:MAG: sigma-54 dependent transcriptional regulator [Desulfarculaceae bacterium]|jgi:DNA-binding NtrC family response regulator